MTNLKLQGLALAGLIGMVAVEAPAALAQYKKTGRDTRSQAQMAEDQCEAQSNGSRQVIVGTLLGGLIGQAIGRDSYVKDCMKARGYEKVKRKRKTPTTRRKDS